MTSLVTKDEALQHLMRTLPVALAAVTCAMLTAVVDYTAGPRVNVFGVVADDFSDLNPTSVLMSLWALALVITCLARANQRTLGGIGIFSLMPTVLGLGAAAHEAFGMFEAAQMIGDNAGTQIFMLYEFRLVSALAFLTTTLAGLALQTAIEGRGRP